MTSTAIAAREDTRSDVEKRWDGIEHDHFAQCLWQSILPGRTIMVECMNWAKANRTVMVVKHFETRIPKPGATKVPWPKMSGVYVYLPVQDGGTWDGLEGVLRKIEDDVAAEK